MQKLIANRPIKQVTDKNASQLKADEATYLKNFQIAFNNNQDKAGQQGGNFGVGKGLNSSKKIDTPTIFLPAGKNKVIGSKESSVTNRLYVFFANSNGLHGIYRINGDTQAVQIVTISARLNFSFDPKYAIPDHRVNIVPVYGVDENNKRYLKDEIVQFVDGHNWQYWINSESSIATGSYDASDFPYYKLFGPHYDYDELIHLAVRPPMQCPKVTPIARTADDIGKSNNISNRSIQFAYTYIYTDGRKTTLSPWSIPYNNKRIGCAVNDKTTPRCLELTLYAGSAHVERIEVLVKNCGGDFKLYQTINKFSDCGANSKEIIGDAYWLRTDPWADFTYDEDTNTIKYTYCGDKECGIYSADDAKRFQTDVPLISTALGSAGDAIILANNLRDYNNLDCSSTDKIEITVFRDEDKAACQIKTVNIKLYAYVSRADQVNEFIFRSGENGTVKFGGMLYIKPPLGAEIYGFSEAESDNFSLNFGDNSGFICYLAGTPYYAVGKQLRAAYSTGQFSDIGIIDSSNSSALEAARLTIANAEGYYIQEFEFNVPEGNYIARLTDHKADMGSAYERRSTYVSGIVPISALNSKGVDSRSIDKSKEILIQACDGYTPMDLNCFYIFSPYSIMSAPGEGSEELGRFITGYLQEEEATKIGIEYVLYAANHGGGAFAFNGAYTDHNGFFFSASSGGDARHSQVDFFGTFNCVPADTNAYDFSTSVQGDDKGYFPNQDLYAKIGLGNSYGPCNRVLVRGTIKDCSTGVGFSGVGITLQGSQTFYTDAQGNFEVVVHPLPSGSRSGKLFYNSGGDCSFARCDCGCVRPDQYDESLAPSCVNCTERLYPQILNKTFRLTSYNETTLKGGGRYGVGGVGLDLAGRATYINNLAYVDVPGILETGSMVPTKLAWNTTGPLNLPKEIKWFSFFVTNNLNNSRYLQWVGDKIEFLDKNGIKTATGNGAIYSKITIQSLLDFNTNNNFSTTTGYQFSAGDRIRIYDDGKGKLFQVDDENDYMDFDIRGTDFNTVAETTADGEEPDGKTLIIDYDPRQLALKDSCGFWLEIISPRACEDLETYCEVCNMYPVIDGELQVQNGIINAFDTFLINRNIVISTCSGNTQSHPFESSSVTDYWGAGCNSCGRTLIKDDNVEQKWYKDEVIRSDEYVNEGRVNGLGTFRFANIKRFKGNYFGGIVAVHGERGMIAFLCENDWFITNYQQEYVKVTASGILEAPLDQNISNPNQKIGDNYGCAYEDTSTIDFYEKVFIWADMRNSDVLICDYGSVSPISQVDNSSYFINKMKYITAHDNDLPVLSRVDNMFDRIGKVDPKSGKYHLTFRPRRNASTKITSFINNEHETFNDVQETFIFDLKLGAWTGHSALTPEFYGRLTKNSKSKDFIAFVNGEPHSLNDPTVKTVNTFLGVKTDMVIELVFVGEEAKDKRFQRVSSEGVESGLGIELIETSEKNQFSYLPIDYLKKNASSFYGRILMNTNIYVDPNWGIKSTLIDGGIISGEYVKVRFVKDRNLLDKYAEFGYLWMGYTDREKSKK